MMLRGTAHKYGANVDTDFILAVGKAGDRVVMLLDVDKVLSSGESAALSQVGHE